MHLFFQSISLPFQYIPDDFRKMWEGPGQGRFLGPMVLSPSLDCQSSVTGELTVHMCDMECRHHEEGISHHLLEPSLESSGVLTVPHIFLHQQVPRLRGQHLAQVMDREVS